MIPAKIHIHNAPDDIVFQKRISEHFSVLIRDEIISITDNNIPVGNEIDNFIITKMKDAKLVLFLISSSFMQNEFWTEKYEDCYSTCKKEEKIILIFCRHCIYLTEKGKQILNNLPMLPSEISTINESQDKDYTYTTIVKFVQEYIEAKEQRLHFLQEIKIAVKCQNLTKLTEIASKLKDKRDEDLAITINEEIKIIYKIKMENAYNNNNMKELEEVRLTVKDDFFAEILGDIYMEKTKIAYEQRSIKELKRIAKQLSQTENTIYLLINENIFPMIGGYIYILEIERAFGEGNKDKLEEIVIDLEGKDIFYKQLEMANDYIKQINNKLIQ